MNLEELIKDYHPPERAIKVINNTKIVLIVGISGAGKDTIKRELLTLGGFREIISHTTRAPRANVGVMEVDGVDYHFIDTNTARMMLEDGEFVEAKFVHGTVYGTSVREVAAAGAEGIAVTDIDVQGVSEYKAVSSAVQAIFVVPPDYETWIGRLKLRYASDEEFKQEWPKRRDSAIKELTRALEMPYYHCVINDELDRAVRVTAGIAQRPEVFTRQDDEARLVTRTLLDKISANSV